MCKNVVVGTCRWFVLMHFVLVVIPVAPEHFINLCFFSLFFLLFIFLIQDLM